VADRIERYLGRVEAELDGRINQDQLEALLIEVEDHLRESEQGWRELGEPEDLANRLAVERFGGIQDLRAPLSLIGQPAWSENVSNWVGKVGATCLIIGTVLTSTIVSSMQLAVPVVLGSCLAVILSCYVLKAGAIRKVVVGALTGVFCLLLLFGTIGRAAKASDGAPVLGLHLGNDVVVTRSTPTSLWDARENVAEMNQRLQESIAFNSAAKSEKPELFALSRIRSDGKYLLINVFENGYGQTFTSDAKLSRESWLKFGDTFIERLETTSISAQHQLDMARQFHRSELSYRAQPLTIGLLTFVGWAALLMGFCMGIGMGFRTVVDLALALMRKGVRYGISK